MTTARVILYCVTVSSLLLQPMFGQERKVDLRGEAGYTLGLEDTPPHARLGGGAVTAAAGRNFRVGVEVLNANLFGKIRYFKSRALLVTPIVEYEFSPDRRINPYLVVGFGFTQYRSLEPNVEHYYDRSLPEFEWRKEGSFNFTGGFGLRLFLSRRIFVAPELRIGLIPVVHSTVSVGYAF